MVSFYLYLRIELVPQEESQGRIELITIKYYVCLELLRGYLGSGRSFTKRYIVNMRMTYKASLYKDTIKSATKLED